MNEPLYTEPSKDYTCKDTSEKNYFIVTPKRNLLLEKGEGLPYSSQRGFPMNTGESSRLEEFPQLKNEIRGSEHYLIVEIDIAKDRHHAFFGTATGKGFSSDWSLKTQSKALTNCSSKQGQLSSTTD
jgi:hypothetical protein